MYQSLADIQAEKDVLHKQIDEKENEMSQLWDELFHEEVDTALMTPSQRMMKYANTALGCFDGVMLGWKLYRRVSGGGRIHLFGKKKR